MVNARAETAARVRVVVEWRDGNDVWGTVGVSENVVVYRGVGPQPGELPVRRPVGIQRRREDVEFHHLGTVGHVSTALISRNSSRPKGPSSRPMPDRL